MNFVCVYYGNKYKPQYVQNLYNMVNRHLTVDHKFICFTDNTSLHRVVQGDIEYRKFPLDDEQGWWNKLQLFHPDSGLVGENLYMDLDVVILKNIDEMAKFGKVDTFGAIHDFTGLDGINSSIMKFNNTTMTPAVWDRYYEDRPRWRKHQGDQNVTYEFMKEHTELQYMPNQWSFSYKWFNRKEPRFSKTDWTFEKCSESLVAVFHGQPNPHESDIEWVVDNWK
jgi:hypothetical protein